MRLSDNWFTAFSEDEEGRLISIYGRDELSEFMACGKLKERVEITWPYEGDAHAMPTDEVAERMEVFETTVRKAMEKDKLAILTAVYTGGNARVWVFYTRTVRVFGERLNEALASHEAYPISIYTELSHEAYPISIYTELDPEWEEYQDMYEMKQWAAD